MAVSLDGLWRSRYVYPSSGRGDDFVGEHTITLTQQGNRLTGESIADSTDSRLILDLTIDDRVITGTWRERTSPSGYYDGAVYHGALQLILDSTARTLSGKWVGFGRDLTVNTGQWELSR